MTGETRPDGRVIGYGRDAEGNGGYDREVPATRIACFGMHMT